VRPSLPRGGHPRVRAAWEEGADLSQWALVKGWPRLSPPPRDLTPQRARRNTSWGPAVERTGWEQICSPEGGEGCSGGSWEKVGAGWRLREEGGCCLAIKDALSGDRQARKEGGGEPLTI
jgi:hypothetical protein